MVSCGKKAYVFKKGTIPQYMTNYFWEWVKVWKWWKKGVLPYNRGWLEQPWKVIKVIELFDRIYDEKSSTGGK